MGGLQHGDDSYSIFLSSAWKAQPNVDIESYCNASSRRYQS